MVNQQENITGSSLTGSDGETNRTYTLANTGLISDSLMVIVDNTILQKDTNYSLSNSTITFLNEVWDDSVISLYYETTVQGSFSGTYYCTPDDVKRVLRAPNSFSSTTNPTETEVYSFIEGVMTDIDDLTRHAWRERTVTKEYHDIPDNYVYDYGAGIRIKLSHRSIKSFDSASGDKLEVWNGSSWDDWLTSKTEGRNSDFWLDEEEGFLFLKQRYWYHRKRALRITYRYGEDSIPKSIREAAAYLVAADIISTDDYSQTLNETGDTGRMSHSDRADRWERKAAKILDNYKEFFAL